MFETLVTLFTGRTYFSENIGEDIGVPTEPFREAWHATERARSIGDLSMEEGIAETLRMLGKYDEETVRMIAGKRREALGDTFGAIPAESVGLLRELHARGIRIGLISNCFSDERDMIRASELFPYFDAVRLSYEARLCKPDPAIYKSILEELGVAPSECLYVGDGGSRELQTARDIGMPAAQALWFRPGMFEPHVPSPVFPDFAHAERQADILSIIANLNYEVTDSITPEEYMEMRRLVGWSEFPLEQAKEGIAHSAYIACFRKEGRPIALARVIWDHGYVVYIADVIVVPEYQGSGLGRELMNRVIAFIRGTVLKPGYRVMVSLQAAKGKEAFYERFGFIRRPNDDTGCGMHQWMETKR